MMWNFESLPWKIYIFDLPTFSRPPQKYNLIFKWVKKLTKAQGLERVQIFC
jgi:hypothetical protein